MQVLRLGARGSEVIKLQDALNKFLVPSPQLMRDGNFGAGTKTAVERFQAGKMLAVDGVAGPATLRALGIGDPPISGGLFAKIDAFVGDVKKVHGIHISKVGEVRSEYDAQNWHVAHMIYYNGFKRKPRHFQQWTNKFGSSGNVIKWEHLQNPKVLWHALTP